MGLRFLLLLLATAGVPLLCSGSSRALAGEADDLFERVIRPYLIERCYECHGTHGTREHDLALDWADGMREGGLSGPAVVPGKPQESSIMVGLRHENDLLMPKGGPKPSAEIVLAFERWIALGAPDPRTMPPSVEELANSGGACNRSGGRRYRLDPPLRPAGSATAITRSTDFSPKSWPLPASSPPARPTPTRFCAA